MSSQTYQSDLSHWPIPPGELLDTLPPGVDEAVAIAKVVQFVKSPKYAHYGAIVFDTAPTGHTLRLLTLPDFLDKTMGAKVHENMEVVKVVQEGWYTAVAAGGSACRG